MTYLGPIALLMAFVGASAGCVDGEPAEVTGTDAGLDTGPASGVTYHGAVRAIVERRCLSCHITGGAAPFALDSWEAVEPLAPAMASAVARGDMPPWNMAPDCRDIEHSRALNGDEKQLFALWQQGGFTEGDPSTYLPPDMPPAPALGPPTLELAIAEPYVASTFTPDDYRCFLLEHTFAEDTYLTATTVFPDAGDIVHHVLIYEVPADEVGVIAAKDSNQSGPGYTCYGGPGGSGQLLAGWVPGQVPNVYPDGAALRVTAGSSLVMQVHYNVIAYGAQDAVPADQSRVALWALPSGQRPNRRVTITPFAQVSLDIPAGDPSVVAVATQDVPIPLTYLGVIPHMHTLGTSLSVTLERRNGERECLADVPDWDFNWQQYYAYAPEDRVQGSIGDTLTLRCEFDNSAANQPVVNGQQQTPRDVSWGEGTLDEMCLNYLVTTIPNYQQGTGEPCDGAPQCLLDCPASDVQCALGCLYFANACFECGLDAVFVSCGPRLCPLQYLGLNSCLQACDDELLVCALNDCAEPLDAAYGCLQPQLMAGACNADTSSCGFQL